MAKKKSFLQNTQRGQGGISSIIRTTDIPEPVEDKVLPVQEDEVDEQLEVGEEETENPLEKEQIKAEAPAKRRRRKKKEEVPSSERGCKDGDTRKTFILKKEVAEKMMDIAYWKPGKLKHHVNKALEDYIKKMEKDGPVRKRPYDEY